MACHVVLMLTYHCVRQGREVFVRSPWHQLRHPLIFYYGHVATLYINKLRVAGLVKEAVNEYMEQKYGKDNFKVRN